MCVCERERCCWDEPEENSQKSANYYDINKIPNNKSIDFLYNDSQSWVLCVGDFGVCVCVCACVCVRERGTFETSLTKTLKDQPTKVPDIKWIDFLYNNLYRVVKTHRMP